MNITQRQIGHKVYHRVNYAFRDFLNVIDNSIVTQLESTETYRGYRKAFNRSGYDMFFNMSIAIHGQLTHRGTSQLPPPKGDGILRKQNEYIST